VTGEGREPAVGLRERHRRRTAAQLEEVALRLFAERGFDAVTVDNIAAEAEVSRRTFFRYFASKEDVLLSDHPRRLAELRAALEARPPGEPVLTALRHALLSMSGGYEEERERLLRRARIMAGTPSLQARSLGHQRAWEQALTDLVAARLGVDPAGDLRPGVVAATTLAAMRVAWAAWLAGGGEAHLPTLVAEALDLLDGGLQQVAGAPVELGRRVAPSSRRSPAPQGKRRARSG
jgi:AcrR family transcriptional regulator